MDNRNGIMYGTQEEVDQKRDYYKAKWDYDKRSPQEQEAFNQEFDRRFKVKKDDDDDMMDAQEPERTRDNEKKRDDDDEYVR